MSKQDVSSGYGKVRRYRVVVEGDLGPRFREAFADLDIDPCGTETALEGDVVDQAQLRGILDRIAALNLTLVSVSKVGD